MGLIIGIGLIGFAFLGGALFVLLGGASIIGYAMAGEPISTILIDFNRLTRNSTILIIPLFTFAGYIIAEGKAPQRLVAFARASVGWLPGGIAVVVLGTCAFFTTFTGASGVTIIALGGLVYPILRQTYNEKFFTGIDNCIWEHWVAVSPERSPYPLCNCRAGSHRHDVPCRYYSGSTYSRCSGCLLLWMEFLQKD